MQSAEGGEAGRAAALAALGRLRAWARGRRADLAGAPTSPAPFLADLFGARWARRARR
jgi:hypothetical protein